MRLISRLAVAVALTVGANVAHAQRAASTPTPSLTVAATNRTASEAAARGVARQDSTVLPGDVIRYTLTFTNSLDHAVRGLKLSNPIPAGLHLVGGSTWASRDDARLEYSIDGGKTFSAQPTESVAVDGHTVQRPASPDRYTNVRWVVAGDVAPKAVVTARFEARLAPAANALSRGQGAAPSSPSGR